MKSKKTREAITMGRVHETIVAVEKHKYVCVWGVRARARACSLIYPTCNAPTC